MIRDLTADGINFHKGVTNSIVEHTSIRNSGDDSLAMWSQTIADVGNIFRFNTIQSPNLANGIAIYGFQDNGVHSNIVSDTISEGRIIDFISHCCCAEMCSWFDTLMPNPFFLFPPFF